MTQTKTGIGSPSSRSPSSAAAVAGARERSDSESVVPALGGEVPCWVQTLSRYGPAATGIDPDDAARRGGRSGDWREPASAARRPSSGTIEAKRPKSLGDSEPRARAAGRQPSRARCGADDAPLSRYSSALF